MGNSHPVGAGFTGNSDCIPNCLIGEMCTVPNVGVVSKYSVYGKSHCRCQIYEDLDCDQNCFISKTCVAPEVEWTNSHRLNGVGSGSIIVLKEGAELRTFDIQAASILPSVG